MRTQLLAVLIVLSVVGMLALFAVYTQPVEGQKPQPTSTPRATSTRQVTPSPKARTPRTQQGQNVNLVSRIGGNTTAVAVQGNYAYIGIGGRLTTWDITNPNLPIILGQTIVPSDTIQSIAVSGNFAYVANGYAGLRIISIADPTQPIEVGSYTTPSPAGSVTVYGVYAYVSDNTGLHIINVVDPSHPTEVSLFSIQYPGNISISGNYAYVPSQGGLHIVRIDDPTHPTEVGGVGLAGQAYSAFVTGNYAYVVNGWLSFGTWGYGINALNVINIADVTHPVVVSACDSWSGSCTVGQGKLLVVGNYAYTTGWGLKIIDISNPTHLTQVGTYDLPGNDLAIKGGYALVASDYAGLTVLNLSDPTHPVAVFTYQEPVGPSSIAIDGQYVYITDQYKLFIVQVTDPQKPTLRGSIAITNSVGLQVDGNRVYVVAGNNSNSLHIVDVTNPDAPTEIGYYGGLQNAMGIAVAGSYAYVGDATDGLRILNVSNPVHIYEVGAYTQTPVYWITLAGMYAYVTGGGYGLRIIDVSDPTHPTLLSFYGGYDSRYFAVVGNYAYVADYYNGVQILNVSNPQNPVKVGSYQTGSPYGVAVVGIYAYVADHTTGLRVLNVADPSHPVEVGSYSDVRNAFMVAVAQNYAYVLNQIGMVILHFVGGLGGPQWTLMFYLDGDNSLDPSIPRILQQLQSAASNSNVQVVVLWKRRYTKNAVYCEITPSDNCQSGANYFPQGNLDMASPTTVINFVNWARTNYPAQHYALILDNHGSGLGGAMLDDDYPLPLGQGCPESLLQWVDCMPVTGIGTALGSLWSSAHTPIDVLYLTACDMGMIEDAYQVNTYVNYYVASENPLWDYDAPYAQYVSGIQASSKPAQAASLFADSYANVASGFPNNPYTISAADLSQLNNLVAATNALAQAMNSQMPGSASQLSSIVSSVQRFDTSGSGKLSSQDSNIDLYDFARLAKANFSDATTQVAAQSVMDAVTTYVIREHHGSTSGMNLDHNHGVSIFFPATKSSFYNVNNYKFAVGATWSHAPTLRPKTAQNTVEWGPMLVNYFQVTQPGGPDNPNPPPPLPQLGTSNDIYLPLIKR